MNRMRSLALALPLAASLAIAGAAHAQGQKNDETKSAGMEIPKPGPENQKLGYFVGAWKMTADVKPGPMGPGGRMTATSSCSWFDGHYAVVCRDSGSSPMGPMKGMGVLSFDREEKKYTYYGIDSMGMSEMASGAVDNGVWTYTNEGKMNGKPYKGRYTMMNVKPDSYDFKFEMSEDGSTWTSAMEGTYKRQGGARKAPARKG